MASKAERILRAATRLFAERGYEGTSVRAICDAAEANVNAVSYHFGGKKALYEAVIAQVGDQRLASAQRLLGAPPKGLADLETRLVLFVEETLAAQLAAPDLMAILYAEMRQRFRHCDPAVLTALGEHSEVLTAFLRAARHRKLLRRGVDLDIVVGTLLERVYNQVHYADFIDATYGTSIRAEKYRRHWVQQTVELLLHGFARTPDP